MTSYLKMATVQEKAMCVLCFFETKSVIKTQRCYRTQYGKDPPSDNVIRRCCCDQNSYTANAGEHLEVN
jgi:hypothetical protein